MVREMYSEYILKHDKDNPRNSEGSLVRLKNGDLLFLYSRYLPSKKGSSDHGKAVMG